MTRDLLLALTTQAATGLGQLCLYVIVARVLGSGSQGIVALGLTVVTQFVIVGLLGSDVAATARVGCDNDQPRAAIANGLVLTATAGLVAACFSLLVLWLFRNTYFSGVWHAARWTVPAAIPLLFLHTYLLAVLAGQRRFAGRLAGASVQGGSLVVILGILAVTGTLSTARALGAWFFSICLSVGAVVGVLARREGSLIASTSWQHLREQVAFGLRVYPARLVGTLAIRSDVLVVAGFCDAASLGFYVSAKACAEIFHYFERALSPVFLSWISAELAAEGVSEQTWAAMRLLACFLLVAIGLAMAFSQFIITLLFSSGYSSAILPLRILLVGIGARVVGGISSQYLVARGEGWRVSKASVAAALLGTSTILALTPVFGVIGAAIGQTLTHLAYFTMVVWYLSRSSDDGVLHMLLCRVSDLRYLRRLIKTKVGEGRG